MMIHYGNHVLTVRGDGVDSPNAYLDEMRTWLLDQGVRPTVLPLLHSTPTLDGRGIELDIRGWKNWMQRKHE